MTAWKVESLGRVCKIIGGGTPAKNVPHYYQGDIPWATVRDMRDDVLSQTQYQITKEAVKKSSTNIIPKGNVVIATRVGLGKVCLIDQDTAINQDLRGVIPINSKTLEVRFLYWWMKSIAHTIVEAGTGATVQGVKLTFVKSLQIPLPPLEEQRRIVAILDEAFEGIEKAQANAEQNLANARELFESYLISTFSGNKGWLKSSLSEVCSEKITDGTHQTPTYFDEGYIFLSSRNVTSRKINWDDVKFIDEEQHQAMHKRIAPRQGDILLAKNGTTGVAAIIDRDVVFDIYVSLAWLRPSEKVLGRFMWHYINSPLAKEQFNKRLKGVGVPNLHLKEIREVTICYPEAIEDQEKIVEKLDQISDEVQRLEAIYEQKLKDLAELKQSLLQKGFSGELTSSNVVAFTRPISEQQAVPTTAPEFAANVLAYAHNWHASQHRDRTFGRVKAQKVLHMAESVAGVDMGRQPIKDAAGPNDFQHMLRAEDWAKTNLFFEFTPRLTGNGYDFKKLGDYSKLIGGALEAVKPYKVKLEKILSIMMPINTREAEVLATVHAAWNNLLLDNAAITDDAIIHEARENWTESKRSIPKNEFRKAITAIRNHGIVPDGTAKRVTGQESLPL